MGDGVNGMEVDAVRLPKPAERMAFTGERYVSGMAGNIGNEHYHRYLFALRFCHGKDVLDVASGEGYGSALIASVARSVVGVEIDEASVAFAQRAYPRPNLAYRYGRAQAIPLADASVDVVVCFETIEHIAEHDTLLDEVARVLREGGVFIVSSPDRRVYSEEPGYRNPFHVKELSRAEFDTLLRGQFSHVSLYEQQVLEGSVLARGYGQGLGQGPGLGRAGGVETFSTEDGALFHHRPGLPRAPYLVAVASHSALDLPAASLLSGLQTDATLAHDERDQLRVLIAEERQSAAETRQALEAERQRAAEAQQALEAERERRAAAEARLYDMDHERGYLRAMVTAARERCEIMVAEHHAAHAAYAEGLAAAHRQVAEAEARLAAAEAHHAQRIEAIRTSTSWRLTGPLRVAVRAVRKVLR